MSNRKHTRSRPARLTIARSPSRRTTKRIFARSLDAPTVWLCLLPVDHHTEMPKPDRVNYFSAGDVAAATGKSAAWWRRAYDRAQRAFPRRPADSFDDSTELELAELNGRRLIPWT